MDQGTTVGWLESLVLQALQTMNYFSWWQLAHMSVKQKKNTEDDSNKEELVLKMIGGQILAS